MEMYDLHNNAPRRGFYKRVRRRFLSPYLRKAVKFVGGAIAAIGLFIVIRNIYFHDTSSQAAQSSNLAFAPNMARAKVPSGKVMGFAKTAGLPSSITRVHPGVRKPEELRANFRRRYGPGFFDVGFGWGNRGTPVDLFDFFDEITAFADIEDMIASRKNARDAYQEELDAVLEKRRQQREERMKKYRERYGVQDREDVKRNDVAASDASVAKKEIPVDTPAGLQKLAQSWTIPSLAQKHDEHSYKYALDIQGMDRDNIKLTLQDRIIIVEGQKMVETENGYHSSSFKRSFTLPHDANLETLRSQELADGTLMLQVQKLADPTAPIREIQIERLPAESEVESGAAEAPSNSKSTRDDAANMIANAIEQVQDPTQGAVNDNSSPGDDGIVEDAPTENKS